LGLGERKNYGFLYIFCRSSETGSIIIIRRRGQRQCAMTTGHEFFFIIMHARPISRLGVSGMLKYKRKY